jgi:hypothetical protein|tara:strand:+ start:30049 stop:31230 length:1182 start_codon:yes stop_codon:yes gene_type:complete
MAKPNIQNITTTQTFQNWFDKQNEMVDLMRSSVITASALGDTTTGDSFLQGEFQANTVLADTLLKVDDIEAFSSNSRIAISAPIQVNGSSKTTAIFSFGTGGQTRYTDGTLSWDQGIDNSVDGNYIIDTGSGTTKFSLSPAGTLNIINLVVSQDTTITGNITTTGTITGDVVANNVTFSTATGGTFTGNHVGDIYASNGTSKVFENGNGLASGVAQFTGNVLGTVSSLTNHSTNGLTEGTNNLYFTTARARNSVSAGTGVSYDNTSGVISIGQIVATNSNVTFGGVGVNGAIIATGNITAYGAVSDITMKENITPITGALEKVQKLGGYLFNYKGDDTPMSGVMAQEIKDVIPGIVYEVENPTTKETVYAVRHGNLVGLLIEAIKELTEKVGK